VAQAKKWLQDHGFEVLHAGDVLSKGDALSILDGGDLNFRCKHGISPRDRKKGTGDCKRSIRIVRKYRMFLNRCIDDFRNPWDRNQYNRWRGIFRSPAYWFHDVGCPGCRLLTGTCREGCRLNIVPDPPAPFKHAGILCCDQEPVRSFRTILLDIRRAEQWPEQFPAVPFFFNETVPGRGIDDKPVVAHVHGPLLDLPHHIIPERCTSPADFFYQDLNPAVLQRPPPVIERALVHREPMCNQAFISREGSIPLDP
jgi:hypothetical protein